MTWPARIALVVALVPVMGGFADAQPRLVIGSGIAIPGGLLGENRGLGPLARLGVAFGSPTGARTFRLDGEVAHMPGRGGPDNWSDASFTSFAAMANMIAAWPGASAPYLLVGGGIQRLHVRGEPNPYGLTMGLRAGLGMRAPLRKMQGSIEIAAHLNVTDFAAGELSPGYFYPVVAGFRF